MPTHITNILAFIADCYTPVLLLLALWVCIQQWKQGDKFYWLDLMALIAIVYGMMFLDKRFNIWLYFSLDYSTHTAASLALIIFIAHKKSFTVKLQFMLSLLVYAELMNLLNYHSWSDILTTAIAIVSISCGFYTGANWLKKYNPLAR